MMARVDFACRHDGRVASHGECHDIWPMRKRQTPKVWTAYKLAKVGKRLGTLYGETEKEALANAQREFAKTELERKRIYLRAQQCAMASRFCGNAT
jgi:hypothetical protein